MEAQDMPSSPRKKLKMDTEALSLESKLRSTNVEGPYPHGGEHPLVSTTMDFRKMQLHKEEDVGITELVSPDLAGFTGVLKKRSIPSL